MTFLPDLIFGTNAVLYKQVFLWFFLLILWAVSSRRSGVRLLPLVVLNAAIALYGVQFALPSFEIDADAFCALGALLNLIILALREITTEKTPLFDKQAFRLIPLLFAGLYLLAGVAAQTLLGNGSLSFLYCLIFTIAVGSFYLFKVFDWQACRFILVFCILWITGLLYYGVGQFSLSVQQSRAVFLSLESLIIMGGMIMERRVSFQLRGEK